MQEAVRALEGFFLGAALQTDPYLEGFGDLFAEPPDEPQEKTPSKNPQKREMAKKEAKTPVPPMPKPKDISYAEMVELFCGDVRLAKHWYAQKHPEDIV